MTNWFTRKTASHIFLPFLHIYHCLWQASAQHQINLGSFNLQRSPSNGDIQLGLGQAANIFGFGADRQLGFNLGPGRFGARTDNGLLLGGQRFGLDSHLGFQEGRGLDLGNLLSLFQPVVNQFISRRPPPSPPALPTSALSQSRPPQTFASFPEEDGQPNGQAVSGPVMPTLIQPPVQPPDAASGAWIDPNGSTMTTSNQGEQHEKEEFPASVGDGWHSSDEEVEVGKETIEKENSNQGQGEIEPWSMGRTAPQPAGGKRVTTEGQFHGGGKSNVNNGLMERRREGGQQSAHDGNTNTGGEEMKKSKGLPIPEGLEPLKKS